MANLIISFCLLISPFILAFLHSSIIYKRHDAKIYANYFIIFNVTFYSMLNTSAYLLYGDYISNFQEWIYTPAIKQIGILEISILIYSIIVVFSKSRIFKASAMLFFSISALSESITIMLVQRQIDSTEVLFQIFLGIVSSAILLNFYIYLRRE